MNQPHHIRYRPSEEQQTNTLAPFIGVWAGAGLLTQFLSWSMMVHWFEADEMLIDDACYDSILSGCDVQDMALLLGELSLFPVLLVSLTCYGLAVLALVMPVQRLVRAWTTEEPARNIGLVIGAAAALPVIPVVGTALFHWFTSPAPLVGQLGFPELQAARSDVAASLWLVMTPLVAITLTQSVVLVSAGYRIPGWVPVSLGSALAALLTIEALSPYIDALSWSGARGWPAWLLLWAGFGLVYGLSVGLPQVLLVGHHYGRPPWFWLRHVVLLSLLVPLSHIPPVAFLVFLGYCSWMTYALMRWLEARPASARP